MQTTHDTTDIDEEPLPAEPEVEILDADCPVPAKAHFIRIAIVGGRSSGKTCILAALSMPRIPHMLDYTAKQLRLPANPGQDLINGDLWLKACREALRTRKLPPPNPNRADRLVLRFVFTDGQSQEHYVEILDYSGELMDEDASQGELAQRLRDYLKSVDGLLVVAEHAREGEEAEVLTKDLFRLQNAFAQLREEQRQSASRERVVPVAMLVNKWDRTGRLVGGKATLAGEQLALETFLATQPLPPHSGLVAELRAGSHGQSQVLFSKALKEALQDRLLQASQGTDQTGRSQLAEHLVTSLLNDCDTLPEGRALHHLLSVLRPKLVAACLALDPGLPARLVAEALLREAEQSCNTHCETFPVSAFGPSQRVSDEETGVYDEKPAQVEPRLHSFGLEDPFLWLIERRHVLDLQNLQTDAAWSRVLLNPRRTNDCAKSLDLLLERMSPGSTLYGPASKLRRSLGTLRLMQNLAVAACVILMILGGEAAFDHRNHTTSMDALTNPTATKELRTAAEHWMGGYRDSKPWRHVIYSGLGFLTRKGASAQLISAARQRDNELWRLIEQTSYPENVPFAQQYVADFSEGEHSDEAEKITLRWRHDIDTANYNKKLDALVTQLGVLKAMTQDRPIVIEKLKRETEDLRGHLSSLAPMLSEHGEKALEERYRTLNEEHGSVTKVIEHLEHIQRLTNAYDQHMERREFVAAATFLMEEAKHADFDSLRAHFVQNALAMLGRQVQEMARASGWKSALSKLDDFQGNAACATVLQMDANGLQQKLVPMRNDLRNAAVKLDYNRLGTSPVESDVDTFLGTSFFNESPAFLTESHVARVKERQDWQRMCQKEQTIRLVMTRIDWGDKVLDADKDVTFGMVSEGFDIEPLITLRPGGTAWATNYALSRTNCKTSWHSDKESVSKQPAVHQMSVCPAAQMDVFAQMWDADPGFDENLGSRRATIIPANCSSGEFSLEMENAEANYGGSRITIQVQIFMDGSWDVLSLPTLSPWN